MAICQISRYAFFEILQNKSATTTKNGLKKIISKIRNKKHKMFRGIEEFEFIQFYSDRGGEFDNLQLTKFLKNSNADISLMTGNKV